jgi:hypothetical protein
MPDTGALQEIRTAGRRNKNLSDVNLCRPSATRIGFIIATQGPVDMTRQQPLLSGHKDHSYARSVATAAGFAART